MAVKFRQTVQKCGIHRPSHLFLKNILQEDGRHCQTDECEPEDVGVHGRRYLPLIFQIGYPACTFGTPTFQKLLDKSATGAVV